MLIADGGTCRSLSTGLNTVIKSFEILSGSWFVNATKKFEIYVVNSVSRLYDSI